MAKHAEIRIDGYTIPLIGIEPSATLETCDLCHKEKALQDLTLVGKQWLCRKCKDKP